MTTPPQHLSDRYELGEILGFGGMSEVHIARDVRLHRDVAVKVLRADLARDPNFYQRFRREAKHTASLNHPSIVAADDPGGAPNPAGCAPILVRGHAGGHHARQLIQRHRRLCPRPAIAITTHR